LPQMAGVLVVLKHLNTRFFKIQFTFNFSTFSKLKVKVKGCIPIPNRRECMQL
jgi:hypothetical protein